MKNSPLRIIIIVLVAAAIAFSASYYFYINSLNNQTPPINNNPNNGNPNDPLNKENVRVSSPFLGQEVSLPFKVKGSARVFESTVAIEIVEEGTGRVIYEGNTMTNALDMGLFGDFEKEIGYLFSLPKDGRAVLNVFWGSPKDGSRLDEVSIPLTFNLTETSKIKVFFNNSKLDPEFSCNKVFPSERIIAKTQSIARRALEVLLEGTSSVDIEASSSTSINPNVKINSLVIDSNGVAKVDFDEQLEYEVGGSCRVGAIRAQIIETLKQFSSVKSVIISINGRTEDILQP